jgi:hypothetical protein
VASSLAVGRGSQLHRPVCGQILISREAKRTEQASVPPLAKNIVCTVRLAHHQIMIGRCHGLSSELGTACASRFTSLAFGAGESPPAGNIQKPEAVHNTLNKAPISLPSMGRLAEGASVKGSSFHRVTGSTDILAILSSDNVIIQGGFPCLPGALPSFLL